MRSCVPFATIVLFLVALGVDRAEAVSSHERVEVSPLKEKGEVVGLRIKLTLRPENAQTTVRIGLGPTGGLARASDFRAKAAGDTPYLLHQFKEIRNLTDRQPKEVTLTVKYADAPGLQPGKEVEVISAWNAPSYQSYWHVYGARTTLTPSGGTMIKLPAAKAPAASRRTPAASGSGARQALRGSGTGTRASRSTSTASSSRATSTARSPRATTGRARARAR